MKGLYMGIIMKYKRVTAEMGETINFYTQEWFPISIDGTAEPWANNNASA